MLRHVELTASVTPHVLLQMIYFILNCSDFVEHDAKVVVDNFTVLLSNNSQALLQASVSYLEK